MFLLEPLLQILDKSKRIREVWVAAENYETYFKASNAFNECILKLCKNNEVLTF